MPGNPFYRTPFWLGLRKQALAQANYRCLAQGCGKLGTHVDHIITRPRGAPGPTQADVLTNLRVLCAQHDAQVKEGRGGVRRNGGQLTVRGCDANGRPLDPNHPWNRA
ncbi:HNH endonuclease [Azospirillum canadense]|uniref:HNH endonuclease n=1 Tax=Azospirillum canadense TaxID=403962 RepID=UPI002227FEB0|nr:HNH endonuclease [Azospirillum canadense]MCW2243591.1 hypothetical protein [Azospirillum canadense]